MATKAQRHHIVELLDFCTEHRAGLLYPPSDIRTGFDAASWNMTEQHFEHILKAGGKWQGDCSEFGSYVLKCAGLWRWSQPGYTGSHLQLLPKHYTNGKIALPGALVVFGLDHNPVGVHEAIVYEPDAKGGDPVVMSHGRGGLDRLRVSDFTGSEFAGHKYLSIAHL